MKLIARFTAGAFLSAVLAGSVAVWHKMPRHRGRSTH